MSDSRFLFSNNIARICSLLFAAWLLPSLPGYAQDAELNPVAVSGTFNFGSEPLKLVTVRAVRVGEPGSATGNFAPATVGDTTIDYELLVNVPNGGTADYDIQACQTQLDSTIGTEQLCFAYERITVEDGVPKTQNLSYQPAYIEGTVTASGDTLSSVSLTGSYHNGSYFLSPYQPYQHFRTYSAYLSVGTEAWEYRVAVPPGKIEVEVLTLLADSGARVSSKQEVEIAAGETATVDIETSPPAGKVVGVINSTGSVAITSHSISARLGSVSASDYLTANGDYQIDYLADGNYSMAASTYFENGSSYYYHSNEFDPSRSATISGENTLTINIASTQAYLNGTIQLTESASNDDLTYMSLRHRSFAAPSTGANSQSQPELPSGTFSTVLSPGPEWQADYIRMNLNRSSEDLSDNFRETLYVSMFHSDDSDFFAVSADETLSRDYELPMGKGTVKLSVAGDIPLSNPYLQLGCSLLDDSGSHVMSFSGWSTDSTQKNVLEGVVSFLAPEGSCWVDARATVGSGSTSFTRINDVVIEPGSDIIVENEGPRATMTYPDPDITVSESPIIVRGLAWDDGAVASVTVNGIAATLGDENAEGKIPYAASVPLVSGENEILLLVLDDTDKQLQITRTVFFEGEVEEDTTPPEVTPPADVEALATGDLTEVDIGEATATDDTDGELTPVADNLGPYPIGDTTVTWSATDAAGNTGTATQMVTVTEPYPFSGFLRPIANLPNINRARAGRSYPVKWQMYDGENYLHDIALVSSITVGEVPCDWSGQAHEASELSLDGRPGLRYDEDDQQFIYKWKTDRKLSGCHALTVIFDDGSQHSALFEFR